MTTTNPITIEALGQVLTSVGLSATLLLFFVWWLYNSQLRIAKETLDREARVAGEVERREQLMVEDFKARHGNILGRLQGLEDFTRNTLMKLAQDTSAGLASNTVALHNNTIALQKATEVSETSMEALTALRDELKKHA